MPIVYKHKPHQCSMPFNWFGIRTPEGTIYKCDKCSQHWERKKHYDGWGEYYWKWVKVDYKPAVS